MIIRFAPADFAGRGRRAFAGHTSAVARSPFQRNHVTAARLAARQPTWGPERLTKRPDHGARKPPPRQRHPAVAGFGAEAGSDGLDARSFAKHDGT